MEENFEVRNCAPSIFLYSDYRQLDKNCEAIRCLNYICSQIYIPNENKEQRDYALKAVWNIAGYYGVYICECLRMLCSL